MSTRRSPRAPFAAAASLLLAALACSSNNALKPAGTACNADSDCAAGLSCMVLAGNVADGGCATLAKDCSKSCALDSDCAPLGSNFKCIPACDGTHSCAATQ